MAWNKEALIICVDVGASMGQEYGTTHTPYIEMARNFITMALQRKIFTESKDEVGLLLFGADRTKNPLNYPSIVCIRTPQLVNWDLVELIDHELKTSEESGDWIDALIVAADFLVEGLQGKKFGAKSIVLISSFLDAFNDDKAENIISALKSEQINVTLIGPEILHSVCAQAENDDAQPGPSSAATNGSAANNSPFTDVTANQRKAEKLIKTLCNEIGAEHFSLTEALPLVNRLQTRAVRPMPWKCSLELSDQVKIPIVAYLKVKENKPKQSWKREYAADAEEKLLSERTFHLLDEGHTEVQERAEVGKAYEYGSTIVPMAKIDEQEHANYVVEEKCLQLIYFTDAEQIPHELFAGDGVHYVFADPKEGDASQVALSALVRALYETGTVMLARYAYNARSAPRVVVLFPKIKAEKEHLVMIQLPFADDLRFPQFPSLQIKSAQPSEAKLQLMDQLIDALDLSKAEIEPDGERAEALRPSQISNPSIQYIFQCLTQRAVDAHGPLPKIPTELMKQFETPAERVELAKPVWEKMKEEFKLEEVEKKKKRTAAEIFGGGDKKMEEMIAEHEAKAMKFEFGSANAAAMPIKVEEMKVGTIAPVEDFKRILRESSPISKDDFGKVCKKFIEVIQRFIESSFGTHSYAKAIECIQALRLACVEHDAPAIFNDYLPALKLLTTVAHRARKDFWTLLATKEISLISKDECPMSAVSEAEASAFFGEEVKEEVKSEPMKNEEVDLLAMLE